MFDSSPYDEPLSGAELGGILGFIGTCLALGALVVVLERAFHVDNKAFLYIVLGSAVIVATLWKPWPFWWHAKALFLRSLIGDRATAIFYLLLGVGSIGWGGWKLHIWADSAAECREAYTTASTTQDRMWVLRQRAGPDRLRCDELREFGDF